MPNSEASQVPNDSRRGFLGMIILLMGAGIGGVMGVNLYGYAIGQALKSSTGSNTPENWLDIGVLSDFKEGEPTQKTITVTTQDGWVKSQSEEAVWVVRKGDHLNVYTATCPHLGCKVQWQPQGKDSFFFCPCHASYFDKEGRLTNGAAARGMDTLEWRKREDGKLQVHFKRFKPILSAKVELI